MKSLILAALFACACTTWKVPAYGTLTAMSTALEGAAEQLPQACQAAAMKEVEAAKDEESAKKNAGAVIERCKAAAQAMLTSYQALVTSRDLIKDAPVDAAAAKNLMTWVKLAWDAYQNLIPILKSFGVILPAQVSN
jgi:uncharacterized glyoxalase superfamily metalloenzyme YdcJ